MMSKLSVNIRLPRWIGLILLLPLAGLLLQSVLELAGDHRALAELDQFRSVVSLSVEAGNLQQQLQRERGQTRAFTLSKGTSSLDDLRLQRAKTDEAIKLFKQAIGGLPLAGMPPAFDDALNLALQNLAALPAHRTAVLAGGLPVSGSLKPYTNAIYALIGIVPAAGELTRSRELAARLYSYRFLLLALNAAGLERGLGLEGFSAGRFSTDLYLQFAAQQERQVDYLESSIALAAPYQSQRLAAFQTAPELKEVERMRKVALDSLSGASIRNIRGDDWFAAASRRMGLLQSYRDDVSRDLLSETARLRADIAGVYRSQLAIASALGLVFLTVLAGLLRHLAPGLARRASLVRARVKRTSLPKLTTW